MWLFYFYIFNPAGSNINPQNFPLWLVNNVGRDATMQHCILRKDVRGSSSRYLPSSSDRLCALLGLRADRPQYESLHHMLSHFALFKPMGINLHRVMMKRHEFARNCRWSWDATRAPHIMSRFRLMTLIHTLVITINTILRSKVKSLGSRSFELQKIRRYSTPDDITVFAFRRAKLCQQSWLSIILPSSPGLGPKK